MSEVEKQKEEVPDFVVKRMEMFNSLEDQTPKVSPESIKIILLPPNSSNQDEKGEEINGVAGQTTPLQIWKEKMKEIFISYGIFIFSFQWRKKFKWQEHRL